MGHSDSRKVAIIGCGFVGSASAFALMQSGLFSEMVLIDSNQDRAEGEALDIAHGIPFAHPISLMRPLLLLLREQARNRGRRAWT